jgi:hypothetical protein
MKRTFFSTSMSRLVFDLEDGGDMFLRNVVLSPDYTEKTVHVVVTAVGTLNPTCSHFALKLSSCNVIPVENTSAPEY